MDTQMKKLTAIVLALLLCLTATFAMADAWKAGDTVTFIVPAKAGGGSDLYTRYLTQALSEVCPGVNFIVTNYETSEVGKARRSDAGRGPRRFHYSVVYGNDQREREG